VIFFIFIYCIALGRIIPVYYTTGNPKGIKYTFGYVIITQGETMKKENVTPLGKAINLAQDIEYADGAIVSKTIIDRKTGTVTLFAFDEGQKLSEHTAPFDALVHIVDGEAELTIGGETVRPKAGEIVIMPANIPHAVNAVKQFKMLLTMIRS
jgi:quercetin dioxygenase-like cupin family protein